MSDHDPLLRSLRSAWPAIPPAPGLPGREGPSAAAGWSGGASDLGRKGEERREGDAPNAHAAVRPLVQRCLRAGASQNVKGRRHMASAFLLRFPLRETSRRSASQAAPVTLLLRPPLGDQRAVPQGNRKAPEPRPVARLDRVHTTPERYHVDGRGHGVEASVVSGEGRGTRLLEASCPV
jgi:hypothetical protein